MTEAEAEALIQIIISHRGWSAIGTRTFPGWYFVEALHTSGATEFFTTMESPDEIERRFAAVLTVFYWATHTPFRRRYPADC